MSKTTTRRTGFTLFEMVISITVLSVTMGSVVMSMNQGSAAWQTNMAIGTLDSKTERALDRVIRYVESASGSDIQPDLGVNPFSGWIDFQEITGYGGGGVFLSNTRRILIELAPDEVDNGVDDNGNGLIDECRIVLVDNPDDPDESRVVIANGVREYLEGESAAAGDNNGNGLVDEPGLCFDMEGSTLNVRLTLEKVGPGGQILTRTLESSVTLMN